MTPPPEFLNGETEWAPIGSLEAHPANPNRGDVPAIGASIRDNGWYGYVVAQRSTRRILVGEHRWRALREEGADVVPVLWVDVDDERARRILLVDNRTAELAERDLARLAEVLAGMDDPRGTGYSEEAVGQLLEAFRAPDPDRVAEEAGDSRPEDFWPVIRILAPPELHRRFHDWLDAHRSDGEDDHEALARALGEAS